MGVLWTGLVLVGLGLGPCFPAAVTLSGAYITVTPNVGSMFVIGSAGAYASMKSGALVKFSACAFVDGHARVPACAFNGTFRFQVMDCVVARTLIHLALHLIDFSSHVWSACMRACVRACVFIATLIATLDILHSQEVKWHYPH